MPDHDRQAMKERAGNEERWIRYLLDDVGEEERAALETSFLRDDQGYQELVAVEDELRYDYLRGELEPGRRRRFEERFLASPEGRRELDRARAVLEALDGTPSVSRARSRGWGLAAAAALLALAGAWSWREVQLARAAAEQARARLAAERARSEDLARDLRSEKERRATLEQELRHRDEVPLSARTLVALALAPGLARGSEARTASLSPESEQLRLTLRLPEGLDARAFQASVRDGGGVELWFRGGLERRGTRDEARVVVDVPARLLAPGDYEVVLLLEPRGGKAEEVADYHFAVARR